MFLFLKLKSFIVNIKDFITITIPSILYKIDKEEKKLVKQIAKGSNRFVGSGVGYHEGEITPRWTSGGINHTHQFLVSAGILILEHDKKIKHFYKDNAASIMLEYADMPDLDDVGTAFASHFWDPDTNKNFLGMTSPTGKTRFIEYYNAAVNTYSNDKQTAYQYLGRALHYLADIGQPHHASNQIAGLTNHGDFEQWVDERRVNYLITSSNKYSICENYSLAGIFRYLAVFSKSYKELVEDDNNWDIIAIETMKYTQKYIAGILYRFLLDVNVIE